ncbi:glucose dehydrogenase [Cnuella takakiae]|nr:glucose dehydrogenase [Cnuella takakiae]
MGERRYAAGDILLPPGYGAQLVASGLNYPTAVSFDAAGNLYCIESGYSYGEDFTTPRLLRLKAGGQTTVIATGDKNGPWTGIDFHEGKFYVAEGGVLEGGRIVEIDPSGTIRPLISNLPSFGDHHTNGPVVRDGQLYFSIGTATNSGVVGADNANYGWLKRKPTFHDIACRDIILSGQNFNTTNVLTEAPADVAITGAFMPYGTGTNKGQVVRGQVPCSGAILRMPLKGGAPQLVAWGLRNPFGLAFAPNGKLYTTENAFDERGSRPVWGAGDVLWEVQQGLWYGWPDFSAGKPIASDEEFNPKKGGQNLRPILQEYPNQPPKPAAIFGVHSSANGFDFSRGTAFGFEGQAFVALFGDMAPEVGKVWSPVGFKVVRVAVATGVIRDFAVNKGKRNGPASWLNNGGLERPVAVKFDPTGTSLYIVDFGKMHTDATGSHPQKASGAIWKIYKK